MEETMLNSNEVSHNYHPSRVKLLAKNIKRGFSVSLSPCLIRYMISRMIFTCFRSISFSLPAFFSLERFNHSGKHRATMGGKYRATITGKV